MSTSILPLTAAAIADLRRVLIQTKKRCVDSEETGYSHLTTGEVIYQLQAAVNCLDQGRRPDFDTLSILFAPTCSLQDIAIDNGWGEEFLTLAEGYDKASDQKDGEQAAPSNR